MSIPPERPAADVQVQASGAIGILRGLAPSLIASVLAAAGAFVSMGLLGLSLYAAATPLLGLAFPPLAAWDQSTVWPMTIAAALLWSPSFLVAGVIDLSLRRRAWPRLRRALVYAAIVWLAAAASWALLLLLNPGIWR